jgi:hypothetical protein
MNNTIDAWILFEQLSMNESFRIALLGILINLLRVLIMKLMRES